MFFNGIYPYLLKTHNITPENKNSNMKNSGIIEYVEFCAIHITKISIAKNSRKNLYFIVIL